MRELNSPFRVLITDENKNFGGAERHVLTLSSELHKKHALGGLAVRKDSWLDSNCGNLPLRHIGFRNEIDLLSVWRLYRILRQDKIKIVHCIGHRDLVTSAIARRLPGAPQIKLVKAEHSYPDNKLSPLFRWAYRQCQAVTSVSLCLSEAVKSRIPIEKDTLYPVIANGIDTESISEPQASSQDTRLHIGVLSPLRPGKGHSDFIEAAATVSRKEVRLSFAGDGELRSSLEKQALELGIEIEFLGHVENPQTYLNSLDLSVVPSHRETFSLVTLESMCCGIPLLAANSEGVQEICREYPVQLYPVGDIETLSQRLLNFYQNPGEQKVEAHRASTQIRQKFSTERMANNYIELYEKLWSTS